MTAKNDVTGDKIKSKQNNDKYRQNYDEIFRSKDKKTPPDKCSGSTAVS